MDEKIEVIRQIQEGYDRNCIIEAEAIELVKQGNALVAAELLNTFEDSNLKEILK
ncbi:MAG: hypothetical protein IKU67_04110 [Firmicutes bacterium]|nr:hypothetical protein [Bacillota bacterium]